MTNIPEKQTALIKQVYESPKVLAVSLRPEEAVLGHCKIAGSAGPVSGSCRALSCKSLGS